MTGGAFRRLGGATAVLIAFTTVVACGEPFAPASDGSALDAGGGASAGSTPVGGAASGGALAIAAGGSRVDTTPAEAPEPPACRIEWSAPEVSESIEPAVRGSVNERPFELPLEQLELECGQPAGAPPAARLSFVLESERLAVVIHQCSAFGYLLPDLSAIDFEVTAEISVARLADHFELRAPARGRYRLFAPATASHPELELELDFELWSTGENPLVCVI